MYTYPQLFRGVLYYDDPGVLADAWRVLETDKKRRFKSLIKTGKRWSVTHKVLLIEHDATDNEEAWATWNEALTTLAASASDGYVSAAIQWDDRVEFEVHDAQGARAPEAPMGEGAQLRFFPLYDGCVWRFSARHEGNVSDVDWRIYENDHGERHLKSHCGNLPRELRELTPDRPRLYHRWGETQRLILDEEAEPGTVWFHGDRERGRLWLFFHDGFDDLHAPIGDLPCALTWRIERYDIARDWAPEQRITPEAMVTFYRTRIALGDRLGPALVRGITKLDLARVDPGEDQALPRIDVPQPEAKPWWKLW